MTSGELGPETLLQHFQVPGKAGASPEDIYVLGLFERRVTLYSQQVRALNLACALFARKRLKEGSQVAVIGAGAAGITATVALAHLGASVQLLERADVVMPLQSGCRTRWLHPHIYDWPFVEPDSHEVAELPLGLGWKAGYAHEVATSLKDVLARAIDQSGDRIRLTCSASVTLLETETKPQPQISWSGTRHTGGRDVGRKEKFDAVISAVGFGLEEPTEELPMSSYWRNDDIDQPVLKPPKERIRCLVSGNGDGGLIDLLRLRIRDFRLEHLHQYLRDSLTAPEMDQLVAKVREWESQAAERDDDWLWKKYNTELQQDNKDSCISDTSFEKLRRYLRGDTTVWFAARGAPISFGSAILNRVWVSLLLNRDGENTILVNSGTRKVTKQGASAAVTFEDEEATSAAHSLGFDRVVIRHGPTSALAGKLKWIYDRGQIAIRSVNALDQTRKPIWSPDTYGPSPAPADTRVGSSASSRAPQATADARAPRVAPAIEFVAHCRVDPASVRASAGVGGLLAPELQWHATIQRAHDLVLRSAKQLDELIERFPWSHNSSDRHINAPAFKQSFFERQEKLVNAQAETRHKFGELWRFLAGVRPELRAAAVRTFASLAALRMIADLRRFEGDLCTDSGRVIANLFPDLPPLTSSWLLRRLPYRSRIGGLALGEERYLLCRVGKREASDTYVLLPTWIAEPAQDDRTGMSQNVFFAWIVPQWFFQGYSGLPDEGQIVWVLRDENGVERWSASSETPWRSTPEIEEEAHWSVSLGCDLQQIEPGWHVSTLPERWSPGMRAAPTLPPLTGRTILWVDDQPDNNKFEMSYLAQLGADISRAATTELALLQLSDHQTDLIISDLRRTENGVMRELAGIELLRAARDLLKNRAKATALVFYTGDLGKVPDEIRPIAANEPGALYALIESVLGTQPGMEDQGALSIAWISGGRKPAARRRALVVGSQIDGLQGADNDARAISATLATRGFEVDLRIGDLATRAGILAGYDALIEQAGPDDAVVVYYAGHGFHAMVAGETATWQCIAPTDLHAGTVDDFRGITSWELAIKLAQLSQRTRNVTLILDCCYSAQMSRDAAARGAVPRVLPHPVELGFAAHLTALRARYPAVFDSVDPAGNPDAVVLVACRQDGSAFEYPDESGAYRGAFTESLVGVLNDVGGSSVSWARVADAVHARVLSRIPAQSPVAEGPMRRQLFSLAEDSDSVAIRATEHAFELAGGRLMDMQLGNVYGVMPAGSTGYHPANVIAEVEVSEIRALLAHATLRGWRNGHTAIPPNAVAFLIARNVPRRPVALDVGAAARPVIEAAIGASQTLRIAASGEPALVTLRLDEDRLTIEDPAGPLFPPARFPEEVAPVIHNVECLGVAQAMRELEGEHGVLRRELEIEIGTVEAGVPRPMLDHRAAVGLRDRIYVQVRNRGQRTLFVHMFNVGLQGRITLLTGYVAPGGLRLEGGDPPFVLGAGADGVLVGLRLSWPSGLPSGGFPRFDECLVIVTSSPVSLVNLETRARDIRAATRGTGSQLQELLAQVQDGLTRDVGGPAPMEGFFVKRLSFLLHPCDAAMGGLAFEIDEDPSGQGAAREGDTWLVPGVDAIATAPAPVVVDAPDAVAIRITDLVAHKQRVRFSGEIRIDALVCTRAVKGRPGYTTWTMRHLAVHDGERLPLDNALLYLGPVRDFVDIVLFASQDTEGGRDLAELFVECADSPVQQYAAATLQVTDEAVAAPLVAAVGASAALARAAYDLLRGATGSSIGLYRTSFLRRERFGIGRHPAESVYRAQDLSFSLSIEPVELSASR